MTPDTFKTKQHQRNVNTIQTNTAVQPLADKRLFRKTRIEKTQKGTRANTHKHDNATTMQHGHTKWIEDQQQIEIEDKM